jgi:hypothetical protein
MRRILIMLTFAAALAGCATSLVPLSETKPVPRDQILATSLTSPREGAQSLTIVRDAGFGKGGATLAVWVDGAKVATIEQREALTVYLPAGEHIITAGLNSLRALGAADSTVSVTIPTRSRLYRISMDDSIHLQPAVE